MKAIIASIFCSAFILVGSASAQTTVLIESVSNVEHDSVLAGGATHTITLRYDFSGAPSGMEYLTSNGFRIYSPDGADWGTVQGNALDGFSGVGFDYVFVNHYHKTGGSGTFGMPQASADGNATGRDTVVVLLAGVNGEPGDGVPAGYNDLTLSITFNSSRDDAGRHICIDTCQQAPGAAWEWANPDGMIEPAWGGVRCFLIDCCSGKVGDVNGEGGEVPTIGDVTRLVGYLFMDDTQPDCLGESDVNQSGIYMTPPQDWEDVTIGDVVLLLDHLFVSNPELPDCP